MKAQNEMTLTFLSRSSNESFARQALTAFFVQLDPTIEEIADIKTAVSEAVTNAIVHGYQNTIGKVWIYAKIYPNNSIYIRIKDNGCGIADVEKAMEPLFTTCNTGERSGLGFAVMQSFMDKVKVRSVVGKGTTVTLVKKLGKGKSDD